MVAPLDDAGEPPRNRPSSARSSTQGNRTLAARLLGVSRATLYNKLEEHGLVWRQSPIVRSESLQKALAAERAANLVGNRTEERDDAPIARVHRNAHGVAFAGQP